MRSAKTFDIAACMYYTGRDPFAKKPVRVARGLHDRKLQRALMQCFKPANYFAVREALVKAGRQDLIGAGCDAPIPAQPPKESLQSRQKQANQAFRGEYVHTIPHPQPGMGHRRDEKPRSGGHVPELQWLSPL